MQRWLNYLRDHRPTYQNPQDTQIDDERIQQLPEDGFVYRQLLNLTTSEIDSQEDQGPPEDGHDQPRFLMIEIHGYTGLSGIWSCSFTTWYVAGNVQLFKYCSNVKGTGQQLTFPPQNQMQRSYQWPGLKTKHYHNTSFRSRVPRTTLSTLLPVA